MKSNFAFKRVCFGAFLGVLAASGLAPAVHAEDVNLVVWSHEADEPAKVEFRNGVAADLENAHPGLHIKITWFEKDGLYTALRTALPAGRGPDVFYLEPDQLHQYVAAKYIMPLDDLVNWNQIYPWARAVWQEGGKTWGIPQEVNDNVLYYNKDMAKKLGVELPVGGQLSQSAFLDLVKKAKAAGMVPIAQGVGDRPYPGAYLVEETLLHKLGKDDYGKLWTGKLSFSDPRVVEVLTWVKQVVDAGGYPKDFMTMKLGESF
jgi:multiple sugar transport system substrate-binding protein